MRLPTDATWKLGRAAARLLSPTRRRALGAALLADERVVITFTAGDTKWSTPLDAHDMLGYRLLASGHHQGHDIDILAAWLGEPAGRTVVDVGANIGTTTVPFAQRGFRVLAIEPVPSTFELLERNVEANGLDRVTLLRAAVSADAELTMRLTSAAGSNEVATPTEQGFAADGLVVLGEATARGVRLDDVAPEDVALVWADVQGHERAVIDTGGRLWASGVPLFCEFWPDGLAAHGGLESFLASAASHFETFTTLDALEERRPSRGLGELDDVAASIERGHADVLLLPAQ